MKNCDLKISIIVENDGAAPLDTEHGLAMLVEYKKNRFMFDFGMSSLWRGNAAKMNIDIDDVKCAFLSHGHNDHTGGLQYFSGTIYCTPNIDTEHFSLHPGKAPKSLTMPQAAKDILLKSDVHYVDTPTEIMPGIFCTGEIPRHSQEDCGGPFFTAREGRNRDFITDESALLLDNGVLIHGCCHSGIINTIEHCQKVFPSIKIHTVIGGLHLLHADNSRLNATADFINNSDIKNLYLMHCTGKDAIDFLKKNLTHCRILTPHAGDIINF